VPRHPGVPQRLVRADARVRVPPQQRGEQVARLGRQRRHRGGPQHHVAARHVQQDLPRRHCAQRVGAAVPEREAAGQQLVEHHADAPEVRRVAVGAAPRGLGGDVHRRAGEALQGAVAAAGLGAAKVDHSHGQVALGLGGVGEVGDGGVEGGQHEVGGLDVWGQCVGLLGGRVEGGRGLIGLHAGAGLGLRSDDRD